MERYEVDIDCFYSSVQKVISPLKRPAAGFIHMFRLRVGSGEGARAGKGSFWRQKGYSNATFPSRRV